MAQPNVLGIQTLLRNLEDFDKEVIKDPRRALKTENNVTYWKETKYCLFFEHLSIQLCGAGSSHRLPSEGTGDLRKVEDMASELKKILLHASLYKA